MFKRLLFGLAALLSLAQPFTQPAYAITPHQRAIILSSSAWTPAQLFLAGQKGAWIDPSDAATVFSDSACTAPASINGAVGCVSDKSGNGNNFIQSTAGHRPTWRQSGTQYYLEFDQADDWIGAAFSAGTLAASNDYLLASQHTSGSKTSLGTRNDNGGTGWVGIAESGNNIACCSATHAGMKVNGIAIPGGATPTRAQIYTAWPINTPNVLSTNGTDLSAWTGFGVGEWSSDAELGFQRMYGVLLRSSLSAGEFSAAQTWLGNKMGLSL